jgi:ATP-dependent Clp protease adaptor protein ClpS
MSNEDVAGPPDTGVIEEVRNEPRTKEPELYKVILHNDHYTTKFFVIEILVTVFRKSVVDANAIMLRAHRSGKAVVGVFTLDIARSKVAQAMKLAKENEYPLRLTVEGA